MAISSDLSNQALEQLIELNAQSFVEAFRLERLPVLRSVMHSAMRLPARRITKTVLEYDAQVGQTDLTGASQWLLKTFLTDLTVYNAAAVPANGPLLIVSNHPGMTDAMALFASLVRDDVKAVAKANPILMCLDSIRQQIIFVPDDPAERLSSVRAIVRHLRQGGTIITFPAGKIELDPALRREAGQTLADWSASIALFAQHIPDLQILPVAVGGVISEAATQSPITTLYQTQARRDWVAATLMVLFERYRHVRVSVRYGQAIPSTTPQIMDEVREQMQHLLDETRKAAQ